MSHDETDLASYAMIEAGSEGASVADGADVREVLEAKSNWDYYDSSLDAAADSAAYVTGCFDENADISGLERALCDYLGRAVELSVSLCDSADWENEWKKYYRPLDFGRLVVVPKWMDGEMSKPKILIDPGMAFGTGLHESTGMCIKLLAGLDLQGKTVLDVGCGSGILGIAALRLGAKSCTFIDIDAQAVEATRSNLALNGLTAEVIEGDLAEKYNGVADVVLANLTADILLRLRDALPAVTKSGSRVIASGIINDRTEDVLRGYTADGAFVLETALREGEWQAFLLGRK